MTRLEIAALLLASSQWNTGHEKLVVVALKVSDELLFREQQTRARSKVFLPGLRRFFRYLLDRIYR